MAYTSTIPTANQRLKDSQPLILANFAALNPWGVGYGQFLLQGSAPSFASGVDGIYLLLNATTIVNELYIHKQSFDAPTDVPFSASKMSNAAIASCKNGWSYLPSGLLMKWGYKAISTSNASLLVDVGSISGGPAYNQTFQVFITALSNIATVNFTANATPYGNPFTSSTGAGNFNVTAQNATTTTAISYLVIGV